MIEIVGSLTKTVIEKEVDSLVGVSKHGDDFLIII